MIVHVVLFRPKQDLGHEQRRNLVDLFVRATEEISAIDRARVGPRLKHGPEYERLPSEDFAYAAILEFQDLGALQEYLVHPVHERLAAEFFPCCERALMYDFEVHEGPEAIAALA